MDTPRKPLNTHEQVAAAFKARAIPRESAVAISYTARDSRMVTPWGWNVWSPLFRANPVADHWRGMKTFPPVGGAAGRAAALAEAQRWASERFGVTKWVRNAQGDYVPEAVEAAFPLEPRTR